MKRILVLMLLLLAVSFGTFRLNSSQAKSESKTWTVDDDGPADFRIIQEAINAANEGDTIFVYKGEYQENLVVNKSLTLTGEVRRTVIDQNYTWVTVEICADKVVFEFFTIRDHYFPSGSYSFYSSGILLRNASNCLVKDNMVDVSIGYGIIAVGGSANRIYSNVIQNDYWCGFLVEDSAYNLITRNRVSASFVALELWRSSHNNITYNFMVNLGWPNPVILLSNCDFNIMEGNTLCDQSFEMTSYIDLWDSCNNSIFHNNFEGEWKTAGYLYGNSTGNIWDNGYPSSGNYWIDYTGADVNHGPYQNETGSDGIGDTPHVIDASNVDRYPLMSEWYAPPAALIGMPGDINLDNRVDIYDIVLACVSYGSKVGDPLWNLDADIAPPYGKIDIYDIATVASHYGEDYS